MKKIIRVFVPLLLICTMIIPSFTFLSSADSYQPFSDVKRGKWYFDAVEYCELNGYLKGVDNNLFNPHGRITREQFVMILANLSGVDTDKYKNTKSPMTDVPTGRWYSGAVAWAVKEGYVAGVAPNKFGLGQDIDRASLVALLYRYAKANGGNISTTQSLSRYADYDKVQPWMAEGLGWAVSNSIITSASDTALLLDPQGTATRAQTAVMLMAYDKANNRVANTGKKALYQRLISTYTAPKLELMAKTPLTEYALTLKKSVPGNIKYIYDWFAAIVKNDGSKYDNTTKYKLDLKKSEDLGSFTAFLQSSLQVGYKLYAGLDANGKYKSVIIVRGDLMEKINESYNSYSSSVDNLNKARSDKYNAELKEYNKKISEASAICDLVEGAVKESGAVGKSERDAINCVISYICKKCSYNYDALNNSLIDAYSINSCLSRGKAVCDGYSKAFYAMCYYLGLDVYYYSGVTNDGGAHAWNAVNVGGSTYYFDITWHDIVNSAGNTENKYVWASYNAFKAEYIAKGSTIYSW